MEFISLILIAILITIIFLMISINEKKKRSVIFLSLTLFILVVPIIILSVAYSLSLPNIKVKELDSFRKEITNKYNYVKQVDDFNYRSMYYSVVIDTTKGLNWEEMKGIYIDTRKFLLSDSMQRSLNEFCDKKYKGNSPFMKVVIEFDFKSDGEFDVKIEGYLDGDMYTRPWNYWNYGDTSFEILPEGEIMQ
jgi:hypothetical protein